MKKLSKRKKQRLIRISVLVVAGGIVAAALLGIVFTVGGYVYRRYFSDEDGIRYDHISVDAPEMEEQLLTPNVNSRPGTRLREVKGIVIHYTANPGTDAQANRDYFEGRKDEPDSPENKVSSHFIIGLDGKIIQCIPLEEIAYASNNRNKDTVSIECCHPRKNGKFSKKTYQSLISLCVWLCARYELEEGSIIRHYDVTGKLCPRYYVKHQSAWQLLQDTIWNDLRSREKSVKSEVPLRR